MQNYDFAAMSVDTLWRLREEMRVVLAAKLAEQQQEASSRLDGIPRFHAASHVPTPFISIRRRADAR